MATNVSIRNKKASFLYEFIDTLVAGVVLTGTEIKSIRNSKANINDAYCLFIDNELWVRGMHISAYEQGGHYNHEPKQDRKLLLKIKELNKLEGKLKDRGLTIIPIKLFLTGKGWAKIEIALAKGKKIHDKREDLKTKDSKREMDRIKVGKY
jgi:SsrA-binding protein